MVRSVMKVDRKYELCREKVTEVIHCVNDDGVIKSASTKDHGGGTNKSTKILRENQPKHTKYIYEDDIKVTNQQTSKEPDGDQQLRIRGFRPDQKELTYKVNSQIFLTHKM
ncbi:unnamed protein product [Arabidopsis thaliana]|uniref:(thale cress) hypothetical protein n=1 Tax=Arabidopsis thaliana TaxID=3702 RepID=A0A7G2F2K0_ARATH|nr:unnamed protein product [Arabidopsis thaliana]